MILCETQQLRHSNYKVKLTAKGTELRLKEKGKRRKDQYASTVCHLK
jgi:hypothetical protein